MKRFFLVVSVLLICLISFNSCALQWHYQIIKTQPLTEMEIKENFMVYEDDNCSVIYNFWKRYGEAGFVVYNKSSENIYIHLDECFFIVNGVAYDYFKNRVQSNSHTRFESHQLSNLTTIYNSTKVSSSQGSSQTSVSIYDYNYYGNVDVNTNSVRTTGQNTYGYSNTYGNTRSSGSSTTSSVSTTEKRIVCIPPESSKIISEYNIFNSIYRSCELYLNPSRKDNHTVTFTPVSSPLTFENRIAYSIGDNKEIKKVVNKFCVTSISNYSEDECTKKEAVKNCKNQKTGEFRKVFKETGANMFYIPYQMN